MSEQGSMNRQQQPQQPPPTAPPIGYGYYPPMGYDAEDEISLIDLWRVLMAQKWMILSVTLLFTVGAIIYALQAPEIYKSEVVLAPVKQGSGGQMASLAAQFGGLASIAGINLGGGGGSTEEAIAILQSRKFLKHFIEDEQLLPVLFEKSWDAENRQWLVESDEDIPSAWDAYAVFSGILSISTDKKSGMVTLSIEWSDPQLAAKWANQLVVRLNKHLKTESVEQAEKSIQYLKDQLASTSVVDMQQILYRLIEKQSNTIMLANVQEEFAFRVIDPAVVPEVRSKPKRKLIVVLGGVLGGMFSIFLAFFLNFLRNQKESEEAPVS